MGFRTLYFQEIASTNTEGLKRALSGWGEEMLLWADYQTAGRGRFDRKWLGGRGNVYMSIVCYPNFSFRRVGELSLSTAVSVVKVLRGFLPSVRCKWPNDVMVSHKKLGGVLVETVRKEESTPSWGAVIGIGINVVGCPRIKDGGRVATSLVENGVRVASVKELIKSIAVSVEDGRHQLEEEGFSLVKKAWETYAVEGESMRVRTSGGILEGRYCGIDEEGSVLLGTRSGYEARIRIGEALLC